MAVWPPIPDDVIAFFRSAFAEANREVTQLLYNVPNVRETTLDDVLVNALIPNSPPRTLPSGAIVEMDIHNIGGLRRLYSWETADIAVLAFIYRGSRLVAQKIGLLQSKRLYPTNNDVLDADPVGFHYGMNAMIRRDTSSPLRVINRTFDFTEDCIYGSIHSEDDQIEAIEHHNREFGESVHYLLYTPPKLPVTVTYPVAYRQVVTEFEEGCLVYSVDAVHGAVKGLERGKSPSHRQIAAMATSKTRLETWASDLLLTCQVGQQFDKSKEEIVSTMLERRSGPISAAIAFSISLPPGD